MLAQRMQCTGKTSQRAGQRNAVAPSCHARAFRAASRPVQFSMVKPAPVMQQQRTVVVRAAAGTPLADAPAQGVMEKGEMSQFPAVPGVYAVYDKEGTLQYIGLTRKVGDKHHRYTCAVLIHACAAAISRRKLDSTPRLTIRCSQVNISVSTHMQDLPDLTHTIKYQVVESGLREELTGAWKKWIEEAGRIRQQML
jgi:hypothetical protein